MGGRSKEVQRKGERVRKKRFSTKVRLRSVVGVVKRKHNLDMAMLNVDGLNLSALSDIQKVLDKKKPDICIIIETHRREEELGMDISIDGYNLHELRRSDTAGDKRGGGIAWYTRQVDGIIFDEHSPEIVEQRNHFVNKERFWVKTHSASQKTAICGAYFGFQAGDDRHGEWNDAMYATIHEEEAELRAQGYRTVMMADFNGHVGCEEGIGVHGNHPGVNRNGQRFLNFLHRTRLQHVNGMGQITKGLWTRQRGASKTIVDYSLISEEHAMTVKSLEIDDCGKHGGGSDHNRMFVSLEDNFVMKKRLPQGQNRKPAWKIGHDQDWSGFKEAVRSKVRDVRHNDLSLNDLAGCVASSLLSAGVETIGLTESKAQVVKRPQLYPRSILDEIGLKRKLEEDWKTAVKESKENIGDLEARYLEQKKKTEIILFKFSIRGRDKVKVDCSGKTPHARRCFWSHVSTKIKQSSEISAVVSPEDGQLKCSKTEIKEEVEKHICSTFQGSMEPVEEQIEVPEVQEVGDQVFMDHDYSLRQRPKLIKKSDSEELIEDPGGWMDRGYSLKEVRKMLKSMKGHRARGVDNIPNEFLINAPEELLELIVVLFNRIRIEGVVPVGWNKGLITLIHKKGLRELLKNYRPITVIISLSGLYSRVLNARLTEVVETHGLLGEDQNGFRKGRRMADNNFILDSVLWKAQATGQKLHLGYVDISRAYDSVNRGVLWSRLRSMGFGGQFLQSLKALYTGDSVESSVSGERTRPVFLRRGLRQGCSLSPILFALYISDIGNDLNSCSVGFSIGGMILSALLFADDIILISTSDEDLRKLFNIVKINCELLLLDISIEKSQVVSPDGLGVWDFDDGGEVIMSLKSVLSYKYLGTDTTMVMSSTGSKKQKKCLLTAERYRYACNYVAKSGPDIVDVTLATWSNIAIPTMLSGCEVIPFSEQTIVSIERVQSQLAKQLLGLPQHAPSVCAQSELGLKPFRMVLWQQQLSFYLRALRLPTSRWVSKVMHEHLEGSWRSPYIAYIARIRGYVGLERLPPTDKYLRLHLKAWWIRNVNAQLQDLHTTEFVDPVKDFKREAYVYEHGGCSVLAQFKLGAAGLGNTAPRRGHPRVKVCPVCGGQLDERHVALVCPGLEEFRREETELTFFRNLCRRKNMTEKETYRRLMNGYDWNGNKVQRAELAQRGGWLRNLKNLWLQLAG